MSETCTRFLLYIYNTFCNQFVAKFKCNVHSVILHSTNANDMHWTLHRTLNYPHPWKRRMECVNVIHGDRDKMTFVLHCACYLFEAKWRACVWCVNVKFISWKYYHIIGTLNIVNIYSTLYHANVTEPITADMPRKCIKQACFKHNLSCSGYRSRS